MKRIIFIALFLALMSATSLSSNAQCKNFAKKICMLELVPYVHDGMYNAAVLQEGDAVELFKTFYSGQEYRIAICGADELPKVQFQVLDKDRNVLYDNKSNDYARVWDFSMQASQQLVISIQVHTTDDLSDNIPTGCVAFLIGFMNKENSFDQF
jgi:hypothetical protein